MLGPSYQPNCNVATMAVAVVAESIIASCGLIAAVVLEAILMILVWTLQPVGSC